MCRDVSAWMLHLLSEFASQTWHIQSASFETLRITNTHLSNFPDITREEGIFQCSKPCCHPHRLLSSSFTSQKNNTTILFPFPCNTSSLRLHCFQVFTFPAFTVSHWLSCWQSYTELFPILLSKNQEPNVRFFFVIRSNQELNLRRGRNTQTLKSFFSHLAPSTDITADCT